MITDILFDVYPYILEKPVVATGTIAEYSMNGTFYDVAPALTGGESINLYVN